MLIRLIAVLFLVASLPALAADASLPPLTPEDKPLVMAFDDAQTTSKCIGNPATPMCAIDTMQACWLRGDHHLCRIGLNLDHEPRYGGGAPHPEDIYVYRVVKRKVLTKKTLPWKPEEVLERPGLLAPQEGDMEVDIWEVRCTKVIPPEGCDHNNYASVSGFIVRREGDRWTVLQWFDQ